MYRLASPEARVYTAVLPNHGLYESRVLGLEVEVDRDRLRFYAGTALLLESDELIARLQARLQAMCTAAQERREEDETRLREDETRRREEAERLREEETRLREEETRLREKAEQEVARLRAELERLKR